MRVGVSVYACVCEIVFVYLDVVMFAMDIID